MTIQLFLITPAGAIPLPIPPQATSAHDLFDHLPVGVYTHFRTFNHNQFLGLAAHLDRLEQSLALAGIDYRLDRPGLCRALDQLCTAYPLPDARLRIDVLAAPYPASQSQLLVALYPFAPVPAAAYQNGVKVAIAPQLHRANPLAKTADFVIARRDHTPSRPDIYEYLLLDEAGAILECSSSNFYAIRDGAVWTAGRGVLEGITRKIILQLVAEQGYNLRLEAPPLAEMNHFSEACLSSSSRGIVPIVQIEDQLIGPGRPGPITRQLMTAYNNYVAQAIRPAGDTP